MTSLLRRWLIAGLLVWIPLGVTLAVISFLIDLLNSSLVLIPAAFRPDIPGLGILLSVLLVLGTGALAANLLGRRLVGLGERFLNRIPLVRTIYGSMKKLAETLFSRSSMSFRQVLLVEYPRRGAWTIAFQTGEPIAEIQEKTGQQMISFYVPTTPNPTSGFFLMAPVDEVLFLDMPVEEAMRLVISLGVVGPGKVSAAGQGEGTAAMAKPGRHS